MKGGMKIGVLGLRGIPGVMGGIETHCEHLYPQLARLGFEVVLFARKPYVDPVVREYRGVRLRPLPCIRNKYLETYLHTLMGVFAARAERVDVLHLHAVGPGLFVPLAKLLGLKVVFTHHGFDYQRQKWNVLAKWVLRAGEFLACRHAHTVIAVAEYIAEHVRSVYRRPALCIPNGVTAPTAAIESGRLKKYGLAKRQYLFALGRFVPEKGFHDLIRAFREAVESDARLRKFKLVIAGRADHEDPYSRSLLASAGPDVIFTGFITGADLQAVFSQARIFVIPSYHEGLPLALLEALSHGLPCLASDIPAHREIQLESKRYFSPGDTAMLANKLQRCLKEDFSKTQTRSWRELEKRYDWGNLAQQTGAVYRGIKAGK